MLRATLGIVGAPAIGFVLLAAIPLTSAAGATGDGGRRLVSK